MDEKGLGKRLQEARQAAGLTQQQLCSQANLSFSTLTKIERGAIKAPSIFTIQAIAGALNQTLDQLVGSGLSPAGTNRDLKTTKSGVKFIYFDVNGCLVHFYEQAFTQLSRDTGVPADAIELAFWHFNNEVCKGTMSLTDFNQRLAERIGVESVDWANYYLSAIDPVPEMQELLVWAAQHYKVGLLTNIMPGMLTEMQSRGILPRIAYDAVIDSSEIGAIKPESQIFEIAQAQSGCAPNEIMIIDDSRANVVAAESFGWHVLWFNDSHPEEAVAKARDALQPAD